MQNKQLHSDTPWMMTYTMIWYSESILLFSNKLRSKQSFQKEPYLKFVVFYSYSGSDLWWLTHYMKSTEMSKKVKSSERFEMIIYDSLTKLCISHYSIYDVCQKKRLNAFVAATKVFAEVFAEVFCRVFCWSNLPINKI